MKAKWSCEECGEGFPSKAYLIDHLNLELQVANDVVATVESQLEDLGVELYENSR